MLSLALSSRAMDAEATKQPENFPYIQLWATSDGQTHIKKFTMKGFDLKKYASVRPVEKSFGVSIRFSPSLLGHGLKIVTVTTVAVLFCLQITCHPCIGSL